MKTTSLKMRGIIATAAVGAALVATLGGCGAVPEATQATSTGAPAETASTRAAGVLLLSVNPEIDAPPTRAGASRTATAGLRVGSAARSCPSS